MKHQHVFLYPPDYPENRDKHGFLIGVCSCGATRKAHSMKTAEDIYVRAMRRIPSPYRRGESLKMFSLEKTLQKEAKMNTSRDKSRKPNYNTFTSNVNGYPVQGILRHGKNFFIDVYEDEYEEA